MGTGSIYALLDQVGRIRYVGMTTQSLNRRLAGHILGSKRLRHHTACWIRSLLAKSERPQICELERVSVDVLPQREIFWIAKLKGEGADLTNSTPGGEGGCSNGPLSAETKAKISAKAIGRLHSESTKLKMRGRRLTEDQKARIVASKGGGRIADQHGRTYPSIQAAARALLLSPGNICAVLKGRISQTGGFSFVAAEVYHE